MRQSLRLFVDDINEKEPNDIAYVYSGYAPLSVRIVQAAISKAGLKSIEEPLKLLPGPAFDEQQPLPPGLQAKSACGSGGGGGEREASGRAYAKALLVCAPSLPRGQLTAAGQSPRVGRAARRPAQRRLEARPRPR